MDAYREGIINLDELREQKATISNRLNVVDAQLKAAKGEQEGAEQTEISWPDLQDLSAVYKRTMDKADFKTKEKIANLLINRVMLYPDKAVVEGIIPVGPYALSSATHASPVPMIRGRFPNFL